MIRQWGMPWLVRSWVDGDTCHGTMDKGWGNLWTPKKGLRLLRGGGLAFDAPELRQLQLVRGRAAQARAQELAPAGVWYQADSHYVDPDDFARPLCSLQLADGRDLATVLIQEGHVK